MVWSISSLSCFEPLAAGFDQVITDAERRVKQKAAAPSLRKADAGASDHACEAAACARHYPRIANCRSHFTVRIENDLISNLATSPSRAPRMDAAALT